MDLKPNESYVADMARRLVRIDSVNPALSEGHAGEREIADYTEKVLTALGLRVTRLEHGSGRASVVGVLRGSGGGRSLMLNAHYDTVGVDGMVEPFSGDIRDGRLWGRGAYDMKGSLAACMGAVEALQRQGAKLTGDLLVAAVADEEHASLGTRSVVERFAVDAAVVTEPTQMEICLAHKGFTWLEVTTRGRAAHGSQFTEGIDANLHMGRVLSRLEEVGRSLRGRDPHPLLGTPSLHAALLRGGSAMSVYAAQCTLGIERRTIPGETRFTVEDEARSLLASLAEEDPEFEAHLRVVLARDPFEVSPDAHIVRTLSQAAETVLGRTPKTRGENPWMDSALLSAADVETVVMGPSGGGAHSDTEWVEMDSVYQLAEILARVAASYCS